MIGGLYNAFFHPSPRRFPPYDPNPASRIQAGMMATESNLKGIACYNKKEYGSALVHYSAAIRLEAFNPTFLKNRGLCHQAMQSYDAALADFKLALILDPSHSEDYRKLIEEVEAARRDSNGR